MVIVKPNHYKMKTFKVETPTTTNYVLKIDGFFFAIRKRYSEYSDSFGWEGVSYKEESLNTDDFNMRVTHCVYKTKKEALENLIRRIGELDDKGFYHV